VIMITDISGARFRISFSQYKPSFPVFTPAEKFMSSRIMSKFFKASYEDNSLGVRKVLTVRYSNFRRSSRAVSTFLLSSTMRILASFICYKYVVLLLWWVENIPATNIPCHKHSGHKHSVPQTFRATNIPCYKHSV